MINKQKLIAKRRGLIPDQYISQIELPFQMWRDDNNNNDNDYDNDLQLVVTHNSSIPLYSNNSCSSNNSRSSNNSSNSNSSSKFRNLYHVIPIEYSFIDFNSYLLKSIIDRGIRVEEFINSNKYN